jgi:hypothetical protein
MDQTVKQYIHVSDIGAFLQCRRAWNFSSNLRQHLTTIEPYKPFYLGTCVHKFFECYYDPMMRVVDGYDWRNTALTDLFSAPNYIKEFIDFGEQLFDQYLTWQIEDKSLLGDCNFRPLSVEQSFDVPIYTPNGGRSSTVRFAGRVDGVWRSKVDGKLYLHEIKTTSSIDSRIGQLQFEMQPTAYMLAMREVYNEPIAGVVYTLLRKKLPVEPDVLKNGMLSQNKGIDTTAELYVAAIKRQHPNISKDEIKSKYGEILQQLLNPPNRFFRRVLITRSAAQLAEMHHTLYQIARDMTNPKLTVYPNPGYFCNNCLFQAPCIAMSNGQPIEPILTQHYTRNTRLD